VAPAPAVAAPASPPTPASPLAEAIVRVALRSATAGPAEETAWRAGVAKVYGQRLGEPIWVRGDVARLAAGKLLAELAAADSWGLEAAKLAIPALPAADAGDDALAAAEVALSLAAVRYAAHARGHRYEPTRMSLWLDQKPRAFDAEAALRDLAESGDGPAALRAHHPRHPEFERLRQAYVAARGEVASEPALPPIPPGPALRPGAKHPDIALVRQRLGVSTRGAADYYDDNLAKAVRRVHRELGRKSSSTIDDIVRKAVEKRRPPTKNKELAGRALQRKLLVNMERWRWLPDDLGRVHVWNNLPEYLTRVKRDGTVIFEERIIIGKAETQTPVFSDNIRFVVFQPEWGVPPSLKVKDLLPHFLSGDYGVLERRNMRILGGRKQSDPYDIDWGRTDIRKVAIVQGAGPDNPLGTMKFMFPNKHDVYMHDTPTKHLFNNSVRTISNGCIRVRNPKKFADLVMSLGNGWQGRQVDEVLHGPEENKRVDLDNRLPVHNVYFTVRIDEAGKVSQLSDIYGHDRRMLQAFDGRSLDQIAKEDPAAKLKQQVDDLASGVAVARSPNGGQWGGGYWGDSPRRRGGYSAPPGGWFSGPVPGQSGGGSSNSRAKAVFESVFGN
jgi:murein L,D-transpeptidase YcbB/YkuD